MLTLKKVALVALFGLTLTGAASARTNTPLLGGFAGAIHTDTCNKNPGNNFIIGFNFDAGKALNMVQAQCIASKINGRWLGTSWGENWYGSPRDGGPFGAGETLFCAKNQYVTSIHVFWDHFGNVHHFRFTCHSFDRTKSSRTETYNNGGVPSRDAGAACPIGQFALGIRVREGSLVNALGLICETP